MRSIPMIVYFIIDTMSQIESTSMISKQKGIYTGKNLIPHESSVCLRQWNHELYRATTVTEVIDGTDYKGVIEVPYAVPVPNSEYIGKPMSMFKRAYEGKISQVTKDILAN